MSEVGKLISVIEPQTKHNKHVFAFLFAYYNKIKVKKFENNENINKYFIKFWIENADKVLFLSYLHINLKLVQNFL